MPSLPKLLHFPYSPPAPRICAGMIKGTDSAFRMILTQKPRGRKYFIPKAGDPAVFRGFYRNAFFKSDFSPLSGFAMSGYVNNFNIFNHIFKYWLKNKYLIIITDNWQQLRGQVKSERLSRRDCVPSQPLPIRFQNTAPLPRKRASHPAWSRIFKSFWSAAAKERKRLNNCRDLRNRRGIRLSYLWVWCKKSKQGILQANEWLK